MRKFLAFAVILSVMPAMAAAALPNLDLRLTSCRDLLCENATDVFLVGEGAYVDYNSTEKGISYWSQVTFPDGTKYQITFPNRITSNVTGNYTLDIVAWKEGYEETALTKVVQFVDTFPQEQSQNPPVLDWTIFLLSMIASVLTVLVVWEVYTHRKRPQPASETKEEVHKKTGKKR